MTNAWFLGAQGPVPQNEDDARSTLEPIRTSGATVEGDEPEWNEFQSDDSPELVGLAPRLKGPDTRDSEHGPAFWLAQAGYPYNDRIDEQVSSSGTAAAREASGKFGHGTMQYADSVEPVVRDGGSFGQTYFAGHPHDIQSEAGDYMAPALADNWAVAVDTAEAKAAARGSYQASLYNEFLRAG